MRRPEDIEARIGNVAQVESVIVAMRALAAAHAQEAARHLHAIREQEATVAHAMADALALFDMPTQAPERSKGKHLRIVVGAAQGFSGAYNERIVDAATGDGADAFVLIGQRCISECDLRGITPAKSARMAAHAAEVPALASEIVDTVFDLLGRGAFARVSIVHGETKGPTQSPVTRTLMPFDYSRFTRTDRAQAPLITLPPAALVARLVEEYVFAEICEALMLGFAAENDARMTAMSRARNNVGQLREDLRREFAQARQEQTTTEIIELSDDAT